MQKLIETLKEFGVDIPEDKQTEIKTALSKHYKNVAEHEKAIGKLEADRDKWKTQAETATETLKSFDGVDPKEMQSKIAELEKAAETAKSEYEQKIYARDFSDALNSEMDSIKFSSDAAKKAVMAEIKDAGLKLKDGKILGLSDLIDQIKKNDASAFVDEQKEQLEANKAHFTQPSKPSGGNGTITKADIMAIKDPSERQSKIAEHIGLFKKGE